MSKVVKVLGSSKHEGLNAILIEGKAEVGAHPNVYLADAETLVEVIRQDLPSGTSDRVLRDLLKAWFDEHSPNMSQETRYAFEWAWRKICDAVSDSPHT